MIDIKDKSKCCGCNACYSICPQNCIEMIMDKEGFLYPYIDKSKCIKCNLCEKKCPILNDRKSVEFQLYGAFSNDSEIIKKSSSGGLFSLLSKIILDNNGVVYGAKYNEKNLVVHDYITTYDEIDKLRGSKYVQSDINDSLRKVKQHLKEGLPVLFSGTPCHIAGLKSYLEKYYENLYCIEIVCHGVPSPKVYNDYIKFLEDKFKSKIQDINFREKSNGWERYSIFIRFENGETVIENAIENTYMKGFLKDLYIRPSCFQCRFKNFSSESDITLGDLWGISNIDKDFYNNNGVSMVSINSKKGKELFEKIPEENICKNKFNLNDVSKYNQCLVKSTPLCKEKDNFFKEYNGNNLNKLVEKYTKVPIKIVIRQKIYILKTRIKEYIKFILKTC